MKRNVNERATGGNSPVYSKRVGSVRAAVWEQTTESGAVFFNVSLVRRYKDDGGDWQDSSSFNGTGDLAAAIMAMQFVADWINSRQDVTAREAGADE